MATDQQANKDVARLLDSAVKSAERRLGKGVVFAPFAFALGPSGRGEEIDAPDPRPSKAIAHLKNAVAEGMKAKRWRATVVAYLSNMSVPGTRQKRPGIGLEVVHAALPAKVIFVPLVQDRNGKVKVIDRPGMPKLWEL